MFNHVLPVIRHTLNLAFNDPRLTRRYIITGKYAVEGTRVCSQKGSGLQFMLLNSLSNSIVQVCSIYDATVRHI